MALINLLTDHLRDTRCGQELFAEGRLEGKPAAVQQKPPRWPSALNRRCGPLSEAITARIQALPLQQLEALTDSLLDFTGPGDLPARFAPHAG